MSIINALLNGAIICFEVSLRFFLVSLIAVINYVIFLYNKITEPWHFAKCFVAWDTYHTFGFYRFQFERGGAKHAARWFYQEKMLTFFYGMGVERNPWLRFQVWFFPWTVPYPSFMGVLEEVMKEKEEDVLE